MSSSNEQGRNIFDSSMNSRFNSGNAFDEISCMY